MSARDDAVRKAARIINAEGGEPDNSLHSWRCGYIDETCTCVDSIATEIVDTIAPIIRADERRIAAKRVMDVPIPAEWGHSGPVSAAAWMRERAYYAVILNGGKADG